MTAQQSRTEEVDRQSGTDDANAKFWDEMCGTVAAQNLGITGNDRSSLGLFDHWFFRQYVYLYRFVPFTRVLGKDVLEVGLGYGTVAQRLAEAGARLTGLDIASGPVAGLEHRLRQNGLNGRAVQGSILDSTIFPDKSFDLIVSLGCLHHTGNLTGALDQTARLLRDDGLAVIMVYNAASYVRWLKHPVETWRHARRSARGDDAPLAMRDDAFDNNNAGEKAPETVLVTRTQLHRMLAHRFHDVLIERTNVIAHWPLHWVPRGLLLATIGPWLGLDLYACVARPKKGDPSAGQKPGRMG